MTKNQYIPTIVFHPGVTLEEKLQEMGMSIKEFALQTELTEKILNEILKGTSAVTQEIAKKFENTTKIPANFWMRYQQRFDEFKTRENFKSVDVKISK